MKNNYWWQISVLCQYYMNDNELLDADEKRYSAEVMQCVILLLLEDNYSILMVPLN